MSCLCQITVPCHLQCWHPSCCAASRHSRQGVLEPHPELSSYNGYHTNSSPAFSSNSKSSTTTSFPLTRWWSERLFPLLSSKFLCCRWPWSHTELLRAGNRRQPCSVSTRTPSDIKWGRRSPSHSWCHRFGPSPPATPGRSGRRHGPAPLAPGPRR
jgi:hypothetical protein